MNCSGYTQRCLARFVIEAVTPLSVGSGEKDIITDALVATDVNGLPYIPGSAVAGVVRHMIEAVNPEGFDTNSFFGFQDGDKGKGSEIIFTEAKILNSKGEVMDGMRLNVFGDDLLKHYADLPIRQHVRINEKGVADNTGKFDEQIVFAGSRFCFELEMVADRNSISAFDHILETIKCSTFRIGGGTRKGFGAIKVVDLQKMTLDLEDEPQRQCYLSKSSALNSDFWKKDYQAPNKDDKHNGWTKYELILSPEDFFLFGSGFGDEDADITPVKSKKVVWTDGIGTMKENLVLIPASSVKGALSHRVAFHCNRLNGRFAGCSGEKAPKVGKNNEAVQALFGSEGERVKGKMVNQRRGNLLLSDLIENEMTDKVLNHVAIDRFTGGAMDGALFTEKTTYGKGHQFKLEILAKKEALENKMVCEAFEEAMKDICKGLLPLGGGVNRGNGVFTGCLIKDGELLYENK